MALMGTCRYIRLDGELTSVKISQDSQYALINRASENGPPAVRALCLFTPARRCDVQAHSCTTSGVVAMIRNGELMFVSFAHAGDPSARPCLGAGSPEVLWAQPIKARHPELLRRRRRKLHRQRKRRYVPSLFELKRWLSVPPISHRASRLRFPTSSSQPISCCLFVSSPRYRSPVTPPSGPALTLKTTNKHDPLFEQMGTCTSGIETPAPCLRSCRVTGRAP